MGAAQGERFLNRDRPPSGLLQLGKEGCGRVPRLGSIGNREGRTRFGESGSSGQVCF